MTSKKRERKTYNKYGSGHQALRRLALYSVFLQGSSDPLEYPTLDLERSHIYAKNSQRSP